MENKKELEQLFDNNFDCYANVDKNQSCLPNWYNDEETPAMTKETFVKLMSNPNKYKYYYLKDGDIIKEGDEYEDEEDDYLWKKSSDCIGHSFDVKHYLRTRRKL